MARTPASAPRAEPDRPVLEWIMSGLGLGLVLLLVGVAGQDAFRDPQPASVRLRVTDIRPSPSGWMVEVEAENVGDEAAAQLQVEASQGSETASGVIDYLPGGGHERVTLGFRTRPGAALDLTTRGWSEP